MTSVELTALVVDDDADNRYLVQAVLEDCGMRVHSAASVAAALEILAAEQIHLLVSDITMPEQDGCDLIRTVRALPDREKAQLPAIALTGLSKDTDRLHVLQAGFDVHITKPFEVNALVATATALLDRANAQPALVG